MWTDDKMFSIPAPLSPLVGKVPALHRAAEVTNMMCHWLFDNRNSDVCKVDSVCLRVAEGEDWCERAVTG